MADDLGDLFERPLKWTESAITALTKKAASTFWGKFKRYLSTASEPLLRKDMGERYLSGDAIFGGLAIWICSTIAALFFPLARPIGVLFSAIPGLQSIGGMLDNVILTILVGLALIISHFLFSMENFKVMAKYRDKGTAYHTQSRGVSRWSNSPMMPVVIIVVLVLFDFPAGIMFVISIGMSAKIASEQQAAIYSRYLDMLDKRIEDEYLENAILGKCPTEITQLHRPLSQSLNPDLRKNIAAAAVGKPVSIVVKGSRTGGQPTETLPGSSAVPQEPAAQVPKNPRAGAPLSPVAPEAPNPQPEPAQPETVHSSAPPPPQPNPEPVAASVQSEGSPQTSAPEIPVPQAGKATPSKRSRSTRQPRPKL